MPEKMTLSEAMSLLSSSKEVLKFASGKSTFYIYKLNSLLIVEGFQYYCGREGRRISFDEIIDILETEFNKKLQVVKYFKEENLCDMYYIYVFI